MSFIISAIYKNRELYIAADTKASSKTGLMKYCDIHKIIQIADTCCIGIAGDYRFGLDLIKQQREEFIDASTISDIESILATHYESYDLSWLRIAGEHANCVFMPVCLIDRQPCISLTTLSEGKMQNFHETFQSGHYNFLFSNPKDFEFDDCLSMCSKILLHNQDKAPEKILVDIVKEVSARSRFVNDQIDIWKAPL